MTVVAFGVALLFPFEVALKRVGLVADHSGFTFWWNQETARYLHEHGGYWLPWYYWLGYPTIGSLEGSWYLNCPWIFCMLSFGILIILVKVRTRRVPIGFPIMPQAPLEAPREGDGEKMAEESK